MNRLYRYENGKRVAVLGETSCPVCEKKFTKKTSKNKYCSRECYYEMKRIRKDRVFWTDEMRNKLSKKYIGDGNPMYGRKGWSKGMKRTDICGENHPRWKGGYWISKDGYKIIENSVETNGARKAEHRKIIEEFIGRKLSTDEIVHHKNGNKLDNRIENLSVVSRAEHINIHRKDIQKKVRNF